MYFETVPDPCYQFVRKCAGIKDGERNEQCSIGMDQLGYSTTKCSNPHWK